MPTQEQVIEALRGVEDPELGMDIVELGLFYEAEVDEANVKVIYSLTSMGCPAGPLIQQRIVEAVKAVDGVGDSTAIHLKTVAAIVVRASQARTRQRDVISDWDAVIRYCRLEMANRETENFRVLFLDRKNRLIRDELLGTGTVDHVPVYTREVVKRAFELNATALILVHNHPSGDPTPSHADIEMTHRIEDACRAVSITVHDHIIIGLEGETSLRSDGYLGSG